MVDEKVSVLCLLEELKARLNKVEKLAKQMHENSCRIVEIVKEYLK